MADAWRMSVRLMRQRLRGTGIDLVHPFAVDRYNEAVDRAFGLPDFGRRSSLGLLLANSRALWPAFVAAARDDRELHEDQHPIDRYVRDRVLRAADSLPSRWEVRWEYDEPPRRIAIQRLAEIAGFARLSSTHLSIHSVLGPWVSLRAVIVVDEDGPDIQRPIPGVPCADCQERCGVLLQKALSLHSHMDSASVAANSTSWVDVRAACAIGRDYRFSDDQIAYHYTKDRQVLDRAVASARPATDES